ncbi:MAG: hypothetical protein IPN22_14615, partial [Bacteroidetes bacterium]|nr:hypothetical protein [Bacteroidota bacterium]
MSEYVSEAAFGSISSAENIFVLQSKDLAGCRLCLRWLVAIGKRSKPSNRTRGWIIWGEKRFSKPAAMVLHLANELEFYVRKAFPDDERILFEFGFADLTYVANSARFVVNAYTMYSIMEDYLVQLQAAGMP